MVTPNGKMFKSLALINPNENITAHSKNGFPEKKS